MTVERCDIHAYSNGGNRFSGAVERVTPRPLTPIFADGFQQRSGGARSLFVP
jgi:hypothetical protein